jgi:tetratricopeptide (TPR) repeat protein
MTGRDIVVRSILILGLIAAISSCRRDRDVILEDLKRLELSTYEDRDLDRKTEAELLEGIQFLETEVRRTVDAGTHLGTYYKMVALKYQQREMYGLAADYYQLALGIKPTNPVLAYWTGVCVAKTAGSYQNEEEKKVVIDEAASYYRYAIRLNPRYTEPLYALSVLLVFEYDDHSSAEPLLERILAIKSLDFRAMFLLAQVYVVYGRVDDAVHLYDKIISDSQLDTMVSQARDNRNMLLGGDNGR